MNIEVVKAVAAVAAPLISKEEHLAGEKVLQLAFKWGEPVAVKIAAIGWRRLHDLPEMADLLEESVKLGASAVNLNHLDSPSMTALYQNVSALCLGEAALKKMIPVTEAQPPTPDGSLSAGKPLENSSAPAGAPMS